VFLDGELALPQVVILCGGTAPRMPEEGEPRPRPMVEIGGRPLLWHLMKLFATHGFTEFVCPLGGRGEMVKRYFLDYQALRSDLTVSLADGRVEHANPQRDDWRVSLLDTGEASMSGAQIKRIGHALGDADVFMCAYGDVLADIDLTRLLAFHREHGRLATAAGVRPHSRFGHLNCDGPLATGVSAQADSGPLVAGGFFVFAREVLEQLSSDPGCALEAGPLQALAGAGQLCVYPHDGFWRCADTLAGVEELRTLWSTGTAPWRVWDDRRPDPDPPGAALRPLRRVSDRTHPVLRSVA
jgi:glucose-1-phosphate cytidylyltransferase